MVWDELNRREKGKAANKCIKSFKTSKTIPGDYLMKLIERMPRVCKAVIKAKGG